MTALVTTNRGSSSRSGASIEQNCLCACIQFHRLSAAFAFHIRCCLCMGLAVSCPRRKDRNLTVERKSLLNTWRRVAFKIILRKRAGRIFGQTGNWLKATKGSQLQIRAEIAKRWSKLGGLLNNHPGKVTGCPCDAEIQRSVFRCARP